MARNLSPAFDAIIYSDRRRQPAYEIRLYDVLSDAAVSIQQVTLENLGLATVDPALVLDATPYVESVTYNERGSDYVNAGVVSSSIGFVLIDESGLFDPLGSGSQKLWLRQGNVVTLREGDANVPTDDWPVTFTGRLVGQPGLDRNRTTRTARITCKAQDRAAPYLRQEITSQDFGQGFAFFDMATSFVETDMGISTDEQALAGISLVRTTAHEPTQFAAQGPLTTLAQIAFIDGFVPRFLGDGRIGLQNSNLTKSPARIYTDDGPIYSVVRPLTESSGPTRVIVKGLDADLTKLVQGRQALADANTTVGFMAQDQELDVYWSTDRTLQAENTKLKVKHSVDQGLFNVGNESYLETPLDVLDAEAGSVGGVISIESGFNPEVPIILATAWIAAHAIPDTVGAVGAGVTIPVGRIVEGVVGETLFALLGTQGHGVYRIKGEPFEFAFLEITAEAQVEGIDEADIEELEIENHLITTQAIADTIALRVLKREQAKQNVRTVTMLHDVRLEPDDIFELSDGSRYMVLGINRTLQRPSGGRQDQANLATVSCFEVTPGVYP